MNKTSNERIKIMTVNILLMIIFGYAYGFFFLIPKPSVTRGVIFQSFPLTIMCICCWIIAFPREKLEGQKGKSGFSNSIFAFIVLNSVSFLYLIFVKNINDTTVFSGYAVSLCVVIYYVLNYSYWYLKINVELLFNRISILAIISIGIQILVANKTNLMFWNSYDLEKLGFRDGYRVPFFDSLIILFIYNSYSKLLNKFHLKNLVFVALGLSYLLFISKSRSTLIIALVGILMMYITKQVQEIKKSRAISIFTVFTFIPILLIIFFVLGYIVIQLYLPIKNGTYSNDGSYFARAQEINYYLNIIKNHPLIGLGNFSVTPGSEFWTLVHGVTGYYYTTDVGLLGDTARLGVGILLIFIWMLKQIFKKNQNSRISYTFVGYAVFLMFAIANYSIFTNGFALGIMLFFINYYKYNREN